VHPKEFDREKWQEEHVLKERDQTLKEEESKIRLQEARKSVSNRGKTLGR
jgi:hypothetical protein